MTILLAGRGGLEIGAEEPQSKERDDVELRVGRLAYSRPKACTFLIILALLDTNSERARFEVEQEITDVEFSDL